MHKSSRPPNIYSQFSVATGVGTETVTSKTTYTMRVMAAWGLVEYKYLAFY